MDLKLLAGVHERVYSETTARVLFQSPGEIRSQAQCYRTQVRSRTGVKILPYPGALMETNILHRRERERGEHKVAIRRQYLLDYAKYMTSNPQNLNSESILVYARGPAYWMHDVIYCSSKLSATPTLNGISVNNGYP